MQLFHVEHTIQNNTVIITDEETVNQCKKVLRLQKGSLINIQSTLANTTTRHLINIQELSSKIIGTIVETTTKTRPQNTKGMLIAMSNKRDKIELITQKLTEIGITQIIFRPAERSVIKERNKTKATRLQKIIKEATEQSRSWFLPELTFREYPEDCLENAYVVMFNKSDKQDRPREGQQANIYGIIGPEGGLSPKDYSRFSKNTPLLHTL